MRAALLKFISLVIDRLVSKAENHTKGRRPHLSKKLDLSDYNRPEYFSNPGKFYNLGISMPDMDIVKERVLFGIHVSRFEFASESASGDPQNDIVCGRIFETREYHGGRKAPCAIIVHGWRESGAFAPYYLLFGVLLARFGINCAFLNQPYHGPRAPRGTASGELMLSGDMEKTILSFRQSVCDTRSLITWAAKTFTGPVGVVGISLGGFIALLACCVDNRVRFAVPIITSGTLIEGMWGREVSRTLIRDFKAAGVDRERVKANWRIITPINFKPLLPPERIKLISACFDELIPVDNVEKLSREWGGLDVKWLSCGHVSIFLFARQLIREIVDFVCFPDS